ncbi:protein-tyrosine sulfotransferase [Lycium barbarum]|uniref:protein-tyrosine sulfotransferase n=1 Tax=Lycium barbarum TaxID=112863 RepID=UPI00293F23A3|nr:protein-tyrosine sulfotransferase [Lycium barbarum]XP_060169532.1 protein-tyrosine sulfotransferase [Lycium barbarum]XP_060169533.1 protein-tyrosine sulfotransferase [Lycium barbarum]
MRQKVHIFEVLVILVFLLSVSTITKASESKDSFNRCEHIVKQWASSSLDLKVKDDKHVLQNLLFFLHVPRTGGRTYFHCFLKKLYASSLECPRSYDKLRFDPRKPKCRLLVTHDDYSMMSKLPKDETSVVTILRNPIDRVFSAYEFSIEVAARFLVHPNLTSATKMSGRLRSKNTISTLDIWPWKYLVPWMREDLFARREARKQNGHSDVTSINPYDMEEMVMPLHEYIKNPIARDILHNGATYQVAGLTNNSYLTEAHDVRHCVLKYQSLGDYVLKVAKKRLDDMLYVGLTDNHKESATMFANVVGTQAISQFSESKSHEDHAAKNNSEQSSSLVESDFDANYHQSNSSYQKTSQISSSERGEATKEKMTAGKLMDAYESCISNLRKTQSERRVNSLKKISPANFTKEGRRQVSEALLQEITSLNSLDVELYKYAQTIFANQHKRMLQNKVITEELDNWFDDSYSAYSWEAIFIAIAALFVLLFAVLFVTSKSRRSKVKL